MSKLDDFKLDQVIGLGGSAIVFSAFSKTAERDFHVSLKIALKVVAANESATQEVEALTQMTPVTQYVNLQDAFLVERESFYAFAETKLKAVEQYLGRSLFPSDSTQSLAVMILNLFSGERLVERIDRASLKKIPYDAWSITAGNSCFSESLTTKVMALSIRERLALLMDLAKALAKRHEFGEAHGDLNPGNILWNPQLDQITLIDLGLHKNFGVAGWRSPEHEKLRDRKILQVPMSSDVYVLGLWIERILGPHATILAGLIERCRHLNPARRPTAKEVRTNIRNKLQTSRFQYPFIAACFAMLIMGWMLWDIHRSTSLDELFPDNGLTYMEKIKTMDFENLSNPSLVRLEIQSHLGNPGISPELRDNLVRTIGWYYYILMGEEAAHPFSGDSKDIQALWFCEAILPGEVWVLFKNVPYWRSLGSIVRNEEIFLRTKVAGSRIWLILEDLKNGNQNNIPLPVSKWPWAESNDSQLILFDCPIEKIMEMIAYASKFSVSVPENFNSKISGVFEFKEIDDLLDDLQRLTGIKVQKQNESIKVSKSPNSEYISWKYSSINYLSINSHDLATDLLAHGGLMIVEGHELIKDERYLSLKATDVYYWDLLNVYCLEKNVDMYLKDGKVRFIKNLD